MRRAPGAPEEFWAERLGCKPDAFRAPGLTLLARADEAVFVVASARGVVAAAPGALHAALAEVADPRALTEWDVLRARVPPGARTVGAAWIGYTDRAAGSMAGVRALASARDPALAPLRTAVTADEWRHANLDTSEPPLFGVGDGAEVSSAAGYQVLLERVAHLGVVTHPAHRGRGEGRRAVAAALAGALERGLLPQYQTLMANLPARRIGEALGFAHFATTLGARWGDA